MVVEINPLNLWDWILKEDMGFCVFLPSDVGPKAKDKKNSNY